MKSYYSEILYLLMVVAAYLLLNFGSNNISKDNLTHKSQLFLTHIYNDNTSNFKFLSIFGGSGLLCAAPVAPFCLLGTACRRSCRSDYYFAGKKVYTKASPSSNDRPHT